MGRGAPYLLSADSCDFICLFVTIARRDREDDYALLRMIPQTQ